MAFSLASARQAGFSLVELVASSMIMGLAVAGVTSMVLKGNEIKSQEGLRQQARVAAISALEDTALHFSKYTTLAAVPDSSLFKTVVLDSASENPIPASIWLFIKDTLEVWNDPPHEINVPFKKLKVTVRWNSGNDTVIALKRLAQIQ